MNPENWYWAELRSAVAAGNWPRAWQLVAAWPSHPPSPRPPNPTHLNPPAHRGGNLPEEARRAQDYLMKEACRANLVSEALRWFWVLEHYLCQPVYVPDNPSMYDDVREGTTIRTRPDDDDPRCPRMGPNIMIWTEFGAPLIYGISFRRSRRQSRARMVLRFSRFSHEGDEDRFPAYSGPAAHRREAYNHRTGLKLANGLVRAGEVMRNTLLLMERLHHQEDGAVRCDLFWCSDILQKLLSEGADWHPRLNFRPVPDSDDEGPGLLQRLQQAMPLLSQELKDEWWSEDDALVRPNPLGSPFEGDEQEDEHEGE